jgi:hypothetical protein
MALIHPLALSMEQGYELWLLDEDGHKSHYEMREALLKQLPTLNEEHPAQRQAAFRQSAEHERAQTAHRRAPPARPA